MQCKCVLNGHGHDSVQCQNEADETGFCKVCKMANGTKLKPTTWPGIEKLEQKITQPDSRQEDGKWIPDGMIREVTGQGSHSEYRVNFTEPKFNTKEEADAYFSKHALSAKKIGD